MQIESDRQQIWFLPHLKIPILYPASINQLVLLMFYAPYILVFSGHQSRTRIVIIFYLTFSNSRLSKGDY